MPFIIWNRTEHVSMGMHATREHAADALISPYGAKDISSRLPDHEFEVVEVESPAAAVVRSNPPKEER